MRVATARRRRRFFLLLSSFSPTIPIPPRSLPPFNYYQKQESDEAGEASGKDKAAVAAKVTKDLNAKKAAKNKPSGAAALAAGESSEGGKKVKAPKVSSYVV